MKSLTSALVTCRRTATSFNTDVEENLRLASSGSRRLDGRQMYRCFRLRERALTEAAFYPGDNRLLTLRVR